MNVAVVDSGANLVAFARMDGAQLASVVIAEHKARTAAAFRRPTRAFEEAARNGPAPPCSSLDGVIASAGGVPLIEDGKLIGAIGCSGGASAEDESDLPRRRGDDQRRGELDDLALRRNRGQKESSAPTRAAPRSARDRK